MSLFTSRAVAAPADIEAAARLSTLAFPNYPIDAEELELNWLTLPEGHRFTRLLLSRDGNDTAYATSLHAHWNGEPERFRVSVAVDPLASEGTFDAAMDQVITWAEQAGARSLYWWGRSDRPGQVKAMEERGFVLEQSNPESCLDLAAFSIDPWFGRISSLKSDGLEFVTYAEFAAARPSDWIDLAYDLEIAIVRDIPVPGGFSEISMEEFRKETDLVERDWPTMWLALEGGVPVGASQLFRNRVNPELASTGITGVRQSHRRRGIAAALKAISLDQARGLGVRQAWTDNEENNPMWSLNQQLGFREVYRHLGYVRAERENEMEA